MKIVTSVYIDPDVAVRARKQKINFSQTLENALRDRLSEGDPVVANPNRRPTKQPEHARGHDAPTPASRAGSNTTT
ncbi:hypothetical protein ASZ90_010396 [hydrocarbon metagenome]|uniref:Uncharacterized protein n=1 Tax=hydrocarbon metagenome TaxID=938273 RepID=A0A0W8FG82_9ZZZZ